ncbi:hypothetical protein SAMN02910358_01165 [Lachnospiraceae bacterium XBB1006]|nr:hypothetical protein SAMN02910358_01165 [Lachnospiraceae bacterium XBB1006]
MIITSSNVQFGSQRKYERQHTKIASKTAWNSGGIMQQDVSMRNNEKGYEQYSENKSVEEQTNIMRGMKTKRSAIIKSMNAEAEWKDVKRQIVEYLVRWLFRDDKEKKKEIMERLEEPKRQEDQGYGGIENFYESYSDFEETSFSTTGIIKTSDGREISMDVEVHMSRSFQSYYEKTMSFGENLIDPLVINTGSAVASVSKQTFYFDMDCDGTKEKIHALQSGSGFLALDRNGDGTINDGSELFGTSSGNGFSDLAYFDQDGNGFIDEADEVFHRLKIWYADGSDMPKLLSLKEANIGAICLGNTTTNFALTDDRNVANAYIRNSGIFLYENGSVGTIQHVDMVKE